MSPDTSGPKHTPVDDDRIADYLGRFLSGDDAADVERAILADDDAAERAYAAVATEDAVHDAVADTQPKIVEIRRSWWSTLRPAVWAPLAAAALIAVVVFSPGLRESSKEPVFRSGNGMELIEPRGEVGELPTVFKWTARDDAAQYRFEIYDAAGAMIHREITSGTALSVPGSVQVPTQGTWRVTPLDSLLIELPGGEAASFTLR